MPHSSSHYPIHSSRHDSSSKRPPTSSNSHSHADRARYWQTILGGQPPSDDHSNSTYHSSSSPPTKPYSSSSRSKSSSPTTSRKNLNINSLNLDSTSRSVRSPPPKPFACQQCERRFERIGHLRSHVDAVHNLRQPYVCHYNACGKTFSHRSSLYRHVKGVHEKHRHHSKSRSNRQLPSVANPYGFQGFIGTRS